MATPYSIIYERAINKMIERNFASLTTAVKESMLKNYLKMAEAKFENVCAYDLSLKTEDTDGYVADLQNAEIEVLALGMVFQWFSQCVFDTDNFKNVLSTKDYQFASPGNLLEKLIALRSIAKREFDEAMVDYDYHRADLEGFGKRVLL